MKKLFAVIHGVISPEQAEDDVHLQWAYALVKEASACLSQSIAEGSECPNPCRITMNKMISWKTKSYIEEIFEEAGWGYCTVTQNFIEGDEYNRHTITIELGK